MSSHACPTFGSCTYLDIFHAHDLVDGGDHATVKSAFRGHSRDRASAGTRAGTVIRIYSGPEYCERIWLPLQRNTKRGG